MRTANLLGAAALAINGRVIADVVARTGVSPSASAALVVLAHTGSVTVTELGHRVGLSQSATARMVDSLEAANLAHRSVQHGRERAVALSSEGRAAVVDALNARQAGLAGLIEVLDDIEIAQLTAVLEKLLARLYSQTPSSEFLCRLCDRAACIEHAFCPVGRAERDAGP